MGCMSKADKEQYKDMHGKTKKGVENWIKKHALYPDSYQSISFSEFTQFQGELSGEVVLGSEAYRIKHTHKLRDVDSNIVSFSAYFLLDNNFDVNIIEKERNSTAGLAFPPKTEIWREKFARPYNANDSLELEKMQKGILKGLFKEIKEGLEKGEFKVEKAENMDLIYEIMDSVLGK